VLFSWQGVQGPRDVAGDVATLNQAVQAKARRRQTFFAAYGSETGAMAAAVSPTS
jgi:hypothetical protein